MIEIYTDWCCKWNPWKGWWGFVILDNSEKIYEDFWWVNITTSNRMEMIAIIEALKYCKENKIHDVCIISDSQFCINVFCKWIFWWRNRNLILNKKNHDLLYQYLDIVRYIDNLRFKWVKWHSWNKWNEYADALSNKYTL